MYFTGKFRAAAHSICNLRHSIPRKIPVLIHNGSSYDFYLIIKHLAHEFENSMSRGEYRKIYFPVMPEKEYIKKWKQKPIEGSDWTVNYELTFFEGCKFTQVLLYHYHMWLIIFQRNFIKMFWM